MESYVFLGNKGSGSRASKVFQLEIVQPTTTTSTTVSTTVTTEVIEIEETTTEDVLVFTTEPELKPTRGDHDQDEDHGPKIHSER